MEPPSILQFRIQDQIVNSTVDQIALSFIGESRSERIPLQVVAGSINVE